MSKKTISAFAHQWYPVYELCETEPTCAFRVDARVLNRWRRTFDEFAKVQEEIRRAQKKSYDTTRGGDE